MKRRPMVMCAAADDDEDLGGGSDVEPHFKKSRPCVSGVASVPAFASSSAPVAAVAVTLESEVVTRGCREEDDEAIRRKAKEFAWMDSDDEEGSRDAVGNADTHAEEKREVRSDEEDVGENAPITREVLDSVASFGRIMLLAPSLGKRLQARDMGPPEVVAACQALGRTKFFDGEMCRDLCAELCRFLEANSLSCEEAQEAMLCLQALNFYDRKVFSAVARSFRDKTCSMETATRTLWMHIFKFFDHEVDKDFLQLLEAPAKSPTDPTYRRLRCVHFAKMNYCAYGDNCSWSHDPRAPISVTDNDDYMVRPRNVAETQKEANVGSGVRFGRLRASMNMAAQMAPAVANSVPQLVQNVGLSGGRIAQPNPKKPYIVTIYGSKA